MILIPDIHICAKYGDKLLRHLEGIFERHKDKEVIFLGDYVYMFSYDRNYLLRLFDLFVRLYRDGRVVKVIAGNHDWLSGHFVFEEGRQAFQIISDLQFQTTGDLQFITQPCHWVDGRNMHVIIPYNDQLLEPIASKHYDPSSLRKSSYKHLVKHISDLAVSSKAGERLSALLNTILLTYYETNKENYDSIVCYHHYYTANIQFPGVQSRFGFEDGAVFSECCNMPGLSLISGHIHEPFSYQNYLCCGSFWHTSASEQNECKYYFVGDVIKGFDAHMIHINPKVVLEYENIDEVLDKETLQHYLDCLIQDSVTRILGPYVQKTVATPFGLSDIDLTLKTKSGTHSNDLIEDTLKEQVHAYSVIKNIIRGQGAFELSAVHDFRSSFSDRKTLLLEYLAYKYPNSQDAYIDFLRLYHLID